MVYSTTVEYQAYLIKGRLEEEEIDVILLKLQDSAYTLFGGFELYVHPVDEERAKAIILDANE